MSAFLVRRLLLVPPMLVAISMLSFLAGVLIPPIQFHMVVEQQFPSRAASGWIPDLADKEAQVREELGLDQPIWLHYLRWMGIVKQPDGRFRGVLEGNLGQSLWESYE